MIVDAVIAMKHTRANDDDADLVAIYHTGAEEAAQRFLNRMVCADEAELAAALAAGTGYSNPPMLVNGAIQCAVLLTISHLYNNREAVIVGMSAVELPSGAEALLYPYRVGLGV